jgi:hypothetical protein
VVCTCGALQLRRVLGTAACGDLTRSYVDWLDAVVHAELQEWCCTEVATWHQARAKWRISRRARWRTSGRLGLGLHVADGSGAAWPCRRVGVPGIVVFSGAAAGTGAQRGTTMMGRPKRVRVVAAQPQLVGGDKVTGRRAAAADSWWWMAQTWQGKILWGNSLTRGAHVAAAVGREN